MKGFSPNISNPVTLVCYTAIQNEGSIDRGYPLSHFARSSEAASDIPGAAEAAHKHVGIRKKGKPSERTGRKARELKRETARLARPP